MRSLITHCKYLISHTRSTRQCDAMCAMLLQFLYTTQAYYIKTAEYYAAPYPM